jgi:histidinol dehydrogenase
MKFFQAKNLSETQLSKLVTRPKMDFDGLFNKVEPILNDVRLNGDSALKKYTKQFDSIALDNHVIDVRKVSNIRIPDSVKTAFIIAYKY